MQTESTFTNAGWHFTCQIWGINTHDNGKYPFLLWQEDYEFPASDCNYWTGDSGTDWGKSGNWSSGVPTAGSNVIFSVDTYPDINFKGIVSYMSDVSDIDSKTVKTFIKIMDKKDLFKQNMFLKLKIEGEKRSLPLIPQSAMVYKDGKFYIYQPLKDGKYELKEVKPVKELPGKLMAVEGIKEGDEIILSAIELERP